jgi:hypothetical protein
MLGPATDVARAAPLRDDAFATKLACVLEDIRARRVKDAIDNKRRPAADQQPRQLGLSLLYRLTAKIETVDLDEIERDQRHGVIAPAIP